MGLVNKRALGEAGWPGREGVCVLVPQCDPHRTAGKEHLIESVALSTTTTGRLLPWFLVQ